MYLLFGLFLSSVCIAQTEEELLLASVPMFNDSSSSVRSKAYQSVAQIGLKSTTTRVRQLAVDQLVKGRHDLESNNVNQVWTILQQFRREDFSETTRQVLIKSLRQKLVHTDELVKIIGYLDIEQAKPDVKAQTYPPMDKRDRWAASLALARMGDQEAAQYIVRRVQSLKLNDDVIYEIFPDLVYTRQPAAIQYMVTILNSDEKNCMSPNPDSEIPIVCGYRVMEQLAPIIERYPLKVGPSGDIETTDYPKALEQVRQWFKTKGTNYTIRKDTF